MERLSEETLRFPRRPPRSRRGERGFSLPEMLLTLLMIGLLIGAGAVIWRTTRPRVEITAAARLLRLMVHQARMQAIFTGVAHFVAIDPTAGRLDVFIDNGTTAGQLDAADRRVGGTALASLVKLVLPANPSPLTNPFGGTDLTAAWPLPNPSGGVWAGRKGVMVTTTGLIETVETTPAVVNNAVIVFSDGRDRASAVGIRGRMGQVRAFEYLEGWKER